MAVYRGQRRRIWPALAFTLAGTMIGFLSGYLVGGSRHASLRAHLTSLREEAEAISGGLEVLEIHYEKAVKDGRVVSPVDYEGVTDNLDALQELYDRLDGDFRELNAESARLLREDLKRLKALITAHKSQSDVTTVSRKIANTMRQILTAGGQS
ncbi:MAG: hypothetical protein ACE5I9_05750 [Candidatus Methylomirabilales bacterium]